MSFSWKANESESSVSEPRESLTSVFDPFRTLRMRPKRLMFAEDGVINDVETRGHLRWIMALRALLRMHMISVPCPQIFHS